MVRKDEFEEGIETQENSYDDFNNEMEHETISSEPVQDKETVVSNIFNTKNRIELLKHRLRGDIDKNGRWTGTEHSLAPESFINKQIGAMESVIDTVNSFSKKNDQETKRILHGAVKAFVLDMANEADIDVKDFRTLAKSYEHSLELFLGLVEFGHGAKVLTRALSGQALEFNKDDNKNSIWKRLTR